MKLLRLLLPFLSLGIILSACQKDYSAESGTAKGNIVKDAAGDCMPILVNGNYVKDVSLSTSNYADVQVNITQLGTYSIKSDTVNGYFFSATGYAAIEGLTTIRLLAIGKPVNAAVDVLTLKFDGSTCSINVIVTATGGGGTAAVFTLNGSPTACAASTQTTNFFAGLPTSAANTVTVFANVTTAGTYTINTGAAINGLTFSAAGTLAAGTNVPIVLTASGTPTAAGTTFAYALTITTPASNCGFTLTVQAAASAAVFTFTCTGATANGTYQVGTAMTAANNITLPIIVTTPGAYSITTVVNGVTFSGASVLTAASTSITLAATVGNIPTASGAFIATVIFGSATCIVPIIFASAPVATNFIRANINGSPTLTTFNVGASGVDLSGTGNTINIFGDNNSTGIENIDLSVGSLLTPLVINTDYTVNQIIAQIGVDANYDNTSGTTFTAQTAVLPQPLFPFTVRFSQISTAPNRVKGTFKGRVDDGGTGFVFFTNGEFDITY